MSATAADLGQQFGSGPIQPESPGFGRTVVLGLVLAVGSWGLANYFTQQAKPSAHTPAPAAAVLAAPGEKTGTITNFYYTCDTDNKCTDWTGELSVPGEAKPYLFSVPSQLATDVRGAFHRHENFTVDFGPKGQTTAIKFHPSAGL